MCTFMGRSAADVVDVQRALALTSPSCFFPDRRHFPWIIIAGEACKGPSVFVWDVPLWRSLWEWHDGCAEQRRTAREPRAAQSNADAQTPRLTWLAANISLPLYLSESCVCFLTSARLFVQQLVAGGALTLKAYWSVHADMRAASVVDHALIQAWEAKRGASGQINPIAHALMQSWLFLCLK